VAGWIKGGSKAVLGTSLNCHPVKKG